MLDEYKIIQDYSAFGAMIIILKRDKLCVLMSDAEHVVLSATPLFGLLAQRLVVSDQYSGL